MASRLVAAFGLETLDVIESRPERLTEVDGIGPKRRQEIVRAWEEQREIKEVMVFLQSHGVSTHYAIKIYKHYGAARHGAGAREPLPPGDRHLRHRLQVGRQDRRGARHPARTRRSASRPAPSTCSGRGPTAATSTCRARRSSRRPEKLLEAPPRWSSRRSPRSPRPSRWSSSPLADRTPAESAVYLKSLHAAEAGVAARVRALLVQPTLPLEIDARARPRLVREGRSRSPSPASSGRRSAPGSRARCW